MTDEDDARSARLSARFRPPLEAVLAELMAERDATAEGRAPVVLDQQSVGRLSRMDAMQMQQMALAADRQRNARISRIRNAFDRMERGEFGYCIACGNDIPEARLEADPSVPLCVACVSVR
jgi:DnaK suppressor protein